MLFFEATRTKDVQVPNLVGMTEEKVKETLKDTKLEYEIKESKYSTDVDPGLVISQDPEYKNDYRIKENTKIGLVISLGQKMTKVPKIGVVTREEAERILKEADLEPVVVEEFDKKVEKGYVIKQDVDPETEVSAGSTVTITVSKGLDEVEVPELRGKTKAEAISEIEKAGLKIGTTINEQDTTKDDGTVLKQSLEPGSKAEKGTSINITVNQIDQLISATAKINLKSLLKYEVKYTEEPVTSKPNGNEVNNVTTTTGKNKVPIPAETVKLKVTVDGETVFEENHKEDETNIPVSITGYGTVNIKVYVDDVRKAEKQVNLKTTTNIVIE